MSHDSNRAHHWAIEQKEPDRGVDAVPVAAAAAGRVDGRGAAGLDR